jgi:hypothetical protein
MPCDGPPVWATWPALHDQRALYRMLATVLALLDKGGLASHRCNGNFGEGWGEVCVKQAGEHRVPAIPRTFYETADVKSN